MLDTLRSRRHGWAYETACSVREAFALREIPTNEDLQRVLDGLGIDLVEEDIASAPVLSNGLLIVSPQLTRACWRWGVTHEVGHHLGHSGDQTRLGPEWCWRQERQADMFAGFLLLSGEWLDHCRTVYEIAETADVPLERVVQWLGWLSLTPSHIAV